MKLDNRPKKLVLKGVGADALEHAKNWYQVSNPTLSPYSTLMCMQSTGQLDTVETTDDGTVYAFQAGAGLLKTTEPSLAWQRVNNGFGEAVLLHLAADPKNSERLFAVTEKSQVLASQDGGKTWSPFQS